MKVTLRLKCDGYRDERSYSIQGILHKYPTERFRRWRADSERETVTPGEIGIVEK